MHCDLWHSHGRIFAYMGRNFMSGICKSKPKNRKNLLFVKKTRFLPAMVCIVTADHAPTRAAK